MVDKNAAVPPAEDHAPEAREPAGYRLSDTDIKEQVRWQLTRDGGLDNSGIVVEVRDGEVTLSGKVRQYADIHRAEQHACAAEGVKLVRNELTSDEPPPNVDAMTRLGKVKPVGAAPKMGKPGYER
jgi:hypothetical protein